MLLVASDRQLPIAHRLLIAMPVEFINLLSSPDLVPARPLTVPNTKKAIKPPNTNNADDVFVLSSDDEIVSKPVISKAKGSEASGKTVSTSTIMKPVEQNTKSAVAKDNNFFFLEEDFDSSAHMDGSFLDLPPAKKRRLSASPSMTAPVKVSGFRRSVSDIEKSSKATGPAIKKPKPAVEVDELLFTSSPKILREAEQRRRQKRKENRAPEDSDDVFGFDAPKTTRTRIPELDESSGDDFPDINAIPTKAPKSTKSPVTKAPKRQSSDIALATYNKERAAQRKADEKERAAKLKQQAKKDKDATRELEKQKKAQEKEDKQREKKVAQELAKVNVSKNDKKMSTPEMIVDLSSGLDAILAQEVRVFLGPLDVEHSTWEETSPIVKWRRKVVAKYNEEKDHWEPTAPHTKPESHIIYVMTAKEFVERATGDEGADLDIHALQLKAKFDSCQIIYIIQELTSWMRKNRNLKNRQFEAAVRSQMPQEEPTASQRRKKKDVEYVDEEILEEALLRLQVVHGVLIHTTTARIDTARWIINFTQHISTIPYKRQQFLLDTTVCLDAGQVKSGDGAEDTYCKILLQISGLTPGFAYGIMAEYATAQKLIEGLKQHGPLALQECRKTANGNGAFTERKIGPAMSKRVYSVFLGRDPQSFDV